MWTSMPWDKSLAQEHVAVLLLLELLCRSPGAIAWPTQTAEGPTATEDPAGDPRKGGNPLCPLSGYISKAHLNVTPLKITHNLFFIQSNCASFSYLCQQGKISLQIPGAMVCADLDMPFLRQMRGPEIFPGILKTYQPFSANSESYWREKLLQAADYQGDNMCSCRFSQLIRRQFLAAEWGNWNLLFNRWCAVLRCQSAFLPAGRCPKRCNALAHLGLLYLHLLPGGKDLSLLLLLQQTNGALPRW